MPTMRERVYKQVTDGETRLLEMEDMIERLRLAGEDVTELELKAVEARQKVESYKTAFEE